jgi:multiple sugar transport system permease protein
MGQLSVAQTVPRTATRSRSRVRTNLWGYLFIAPWLFGFFVFTFGPFVASLWLGFTRWGLLDTPAFIGLKNYVDLGHDPLFAKSLLNTAYYTVFHVPLSMLLAFILAVLLNQKIRGIPLYRTLFYLPSITASVATAILWVYLLQPDGIVNALLARIGIAGPPWLADSFWAMPSLIMISLWSIGGTMIIYLAGLQGVPQHLYEAAVIDGAGWWAKTRNVTIPMMTPTILLTAILGVIGSFQVFDNAFIITSGGPANATLVYILLLYENAFEYFKMGYAAAMAWVLFLIVLLVTLVQLRVARTWVYYESEQR